MTSMILAGGLYHRFPWRHLPPLDSLNIFGFFTRNILDINQMIVHLANSKCFLSTHKTDNKRGFKTTTFETLIWGGTTMKSFMKLHELLSHPFVPSLELLCEKKRTQHQQQRKKLNFVKLNPLIYTFYISVLFAGLSNNALLNL